MHWVWIVEIVRIGSFIFLAILVIYQANAFHQEPADSGLLMSSEWIEQDVLQSISDNDREELELFFANLVEQDQFGYVLFSEKPIALSGGFVKTPSDNVLIGVETGCLCLKRWALWKSYFERIQFPNFLLIEENFAASPDICFIFLINKTLFAKTIRDHSNRFSEITGCSIDPVKILSDLEQGKTTLQQAIFFNEELLGILLGFGEHNAGLFAKRRQLQGPLLIPLALKNEPSIGFNSVEEEVSSMCGRLQNPYNDDFGVYRIDPVIFVADRSHPETTTLCRKYIKARARLSKLYKNQSYFDVSLKQLISDQGVACDACCDERSGYGQRKRDQHSRGKKNIEGERDDQ